MGNGENVQRENKPFFFLSIWYSSHILISPLVDLGPSPVDLGLRESNSSKCFHLLVGSLTTVYLCSCDTCLKRMSDAEKMPKKRSYFLPQILGYSSCPSILLPVDLGLR